MGNQVKKPSVIRSLPRISAEVPIPHPPADEKEAEKLTHEAKLGRKELLSLWGRWASSPIIGELQKRTWEKDQKKPPILEIPASTNAPKDARIFIGAVNLRSELLGGMVTGAFALLGDTEKGAGNRAHLLHVSPQTPNSQMLSHSTWYRADDQPPEFQRNGLLKSFAGTRMLAYRELRTPEFIADSVHTFLREQEHTDTPLDLPTI